MIQALLQICATLIALPAVVISIVRILRDAA